MARPSGQSPLRLSTDAEGIVPAAARLPGLDLPPPRRSSLVVQHPVRTGQRIHAEGADLIVLGPVSAGAELSADGCIHVYGTLRGAVFAGADGDTSARIFAKNFEASRVSIAGLWLGAEDLDPAWSNRPVQLRISGGRLQVEPLT